MRQYIIEDIQPEHMQRIKTALHDRSLEGSIDDIYWLPVPPELLSQEQKEHEACGPHILTLETGDSWLRLELLIRARSIIRCSCVQYASPALREQMINWVDTLLKELDIPV